jgi:hypothetical protein
MLIFSTGGRMKKLSDKKLRKLLFTCLLLFFAMSCGMHVDFNSGNTDAEKSQRAIMCKNLCNKEHYNVKFIRHDGTIEYYKIGIVSITGKTACECKF